MYHFYEISVFFYKLIEICWLLLVFLLKLLSSCRGMRFYSLIHIAIKILVDTELQKVLDQYKHHILSRFIIHRVPQSEGQTLTIKKQH